MRRQKQEPSQTDLDQNGKQHGTTPLLAAVKTKEKDPLEPPPTPPPGSPGDKHP